MIGRLFSAAAVLLVMVFSSPAPAYQMDCRFWTRFADGKWAPTHTITIDVGGNRWVLGENTTLLPDRDAIIDLSAALEQQTGERR